MSEAANLAFWWIFVLNSVKHKFFPVSVVKFESFKIFFNKNRNVMDDTEKIADSNLT